MTNKLYNKIESNVKAVQQRIFSAAQKTGRNPDEITLLGVTKTQSCEAVRNLLNAGVFEIGENKVQELLDKKKDLADIPHKTHLIGHLQRNKAKFLPGNVDLVQSLDSIKVAKALENAFSGQNMALDVLIQVNIAGEGSKDGIDIKNLPELAEYVLSSQILSLRGLMCIPPFGLGEGICRYFEQMQQLFIDIQTKKMDNNSINILSMGMSADFEYAIQEGSTMVRVGTDLFGLRE